MNGNNKKLKLLATVCLLMSGMIGSAIFSLSGLTISYAGPSSIISWILAAVIQLFYGLSMAELATTYKKSGGVFVFPESSFDGEKGTRLGFISAWGNFMADVVSIAFSAMYVGIYLSASFPVLSKYQMLISIIAIFICLFLNSINFSTAGKINILLSSVLFIILIIFVFLCIRSGYFDVEKMIPFFSQGVKGNIGFIRAVPIAMIGYSAVMSISFMVQDIYKPEKNIIRAVYIGVVITSALYALVILAVVGTITTAELISSDMVFIPLFAACYTKLINYPFIQTCISMAAVIALLTTMLVVMAVNGRCLKVVAEKRLLPKIFGKIGKNETPIYAMTFLAMLSCIFSFFPHITETLVNLGALFAIITIVINFLSLIETRKKNIKSNFKAPLSNVGIVCIMIIFALCYLPDIISGGYVLMIYTVVWYIIGIIYYKVYRR